MQKMLGKGLAGFAFPLTCFIPFRLAYVIIVYLPLKFFPNLAGVHAEMSPAECVGWLEAAPMDLGRYIDFQLDVNLVMVVYFPGCDTIKMFISLAARRKFATPGGLLLSCLVSE